MSKLKERLAAKRKELMMDLAMGAAVAGGVSAPADAQAATHAALAEQAAAHTEMVNQAPERTDPPTSGFRLEPVSAQQGTMQSGEMNEQQIYASLPEHAKVYLRNTGKVIDVRLSNALNTVGGNSQNKSGYCMVCYQPSNPNMVTFYPNLPGSGNVQSKVVTVVRSKKSIRKINGATVEVEASNSAEGMLQNQTGPFAPPTVNVRRVREPVHTQTTRLPGYDNRRRTTASGEVVSEDTKIAGGVYRSGKRSNGDTYEEINVRKGARKTGDLIKQVDKSKKTRKKVNDVQRIINIISR